MVILFSERKNTGPLFHILGASITEYFQPVSAPFCKVLTATLNMSFNEAIRQSVVSHASKEPGARAAGFVGTSFAYVG